MPKCDHLDWHQEISGSFGPGEEHQRERKKKPTEQKRPHPRGVGRLEKERTIGSGGTLLHCNQPYGVPPEAYLNMHNNINERNKKHMSEKNKSKCKDRAALSIYPLSEPSLWEKG